MNFLAAMNVLVTWDANFKSSPAGGDAPDTLDNTIRDTRAAVEERISNEHTNVVTGTGGSVAEDWLHKPGSAKAYYQAAAPTLRPDGVTTLNSADAGRIWVDSDTNFVYAWDGSAWQPASSPVALLDFGAITASDTGIVKSYLSAYTSATSYGKATVSGVATGGTPMRALALFTGTVRIKFTLSTTDGSYTSYGRIYLNDVAEGTERSTTSAAGEEFSEDISVTAGDEISIYTKASSGTKLAIVTDFKLYGDLGDATLQAACEKIAYWTAYGGPV